MWRLPAGPPLYLRCAPTEPPDGSRPYRVTISMAGWRWRAVRAIRRADCSRSGLRRSGQGCAVPIAFGRFSPRRWGGRRFPLGPPRRAAARCWRVLHCVPAAASRRSRRSNRVCRAAGRKCAGSADRRATGAARSARAGRGSRRPSSPARSAMSARSARAGRGSRPSARRAGTRRCAHQLGLSW